LSAAFYAKIIFSDHFGIGSGCRSYSYRVVAALERTGVERKF